MKKKKKMEQQQQQQQKGLVQNNPLKESHQSETAGITTTADPKS